jgi:hypothetical protein
VKRKELVVEYLEGLEGLSITLASSSSESEPEAELESGLGAISQVWVGCSNDSRRI